MARPNESATAADPSHIPPFVRPLAPYIKSRQEALRIRQALTSYLRSQITFADNDPEHPDCHAHSHLSLCVPGDAVLEVKRIPAELTGLRKEYLQALQANVAARKQHQLISEKLVSAKPSEGSAGAGISDSSCSLDLQAYLRLVRDRRRHAKLQVFEHYLRELRARETAKAEDFEAQEDRNRLALSDEFVDEGQNDSAKGGDEGLLNRLERAVIRAKTQLDCEKKLYEELLARKASEGRQTEEPAPSVKIAALQRTRDELVQWVEEKLVTGGNGEDAPALELPTEEIEESARILQEQRARILEQYAVYIDTRKRLLEAASRACQPVSAASAKAPTRPPDVGRRSSAEERLPVEPLEVLSFATDVLHPLTQSQRSLALQKFYLSALLDKEKNTTLRILNRLSDESHLLPEYPILARQPRFKHAAAAIGARHVTDQSESAKPDEIVALAEAWAFASAAAGSGEKEYVEIRVTEGSERVEQAWKVLQKVYDILGQNLEETLEDEHSGKEPNDIWAYEAQSTRPRSGLTRTERRSKGPWTRLNGRVGLADERLW